jgi:hypothetical protein
LLLAWHAADPVSQKELARNDSIFLIQGNRNPYIDNPQWVYSIWGPLAGMSEELAAQARVWYANEQLIIVRHGQQDLLPVEVIDATGRTVLTTTVNGDRTVLPFDATHGMYVALIGKSPERLAVRFVR